MLKKSHGKYNVSNAAVTYMKLTLFTVANNHIAEMKNKYGLQNLHMGEVASLIANHPDRKKSQD